MAVGVGTAVAGLASSSAAKKGSKASGDANALAYEQYMQQRADQMPWRNLGVSALGALGQGLGIGGSAENQWETRDQVRARLTPQFRGNYGGNGIDDAGLDAATDAEFADIERMRQAAGNGAGSGGTGIGFGDLSRSFTLADFEKDPGYEFRLNEGLGAVQGSAAARGSMLSGATLKALNDYGSNYASSEYGKAYDRFNNDNTQRFNRLATIAGIGQTANNNVGAASQNYTNLYGSNLASGANASAGGAVGVGNAVNSGLSNLRSLYYMNNLNSGTGPTVGGNPAGYLESTGSGSTYVP